MHFGFIVLFYIWEPWDVCWFSSDFHKMSIANHLLTKWNWMLWLVTDLRKTSWNSLIRVLKHHAIDSAGFDWILIWKTLLLSFVLKNSTASAQFFVIFTAPNLFQIKNPDCERSKFPQDQIDTHLDIYSLAYIMRSCVFRQS